MRKPYTQLYVHLVWATWDRLPLLDHALRPRVYRCIQREAFNLGCEVGAIGGIEDHVHVLVRCAPTVAVSNLVKQIKGSSSRLVQRELRPGEFFKWQGSYGAFSIAETHIEPVRRYIRRQEEHHRTGRLNATLERTFLDDAPGPANSGSPPRTR
ncbi:MAG TPA: IS200/IS605 family transposase [Longimicrobium sp.]|uniref:IS200/IS605 family transposase n=1 Tax=Longimicrobium sp. TaxID=2029185 RepID=UPI002ED98C1A